MNAEKLKTITIIDCSSFVHRKCHKWTVWNSWLWIRMQSSVLVIIH